MKLLSWLAGRGKSDHQIRRRHNVARRRPLFEVLEDRTLPTIVFAPIAGPEVASKDDGYVLRSPPVYFIFWGSYFGTPAGIQAGNNFVAEAKALLASGYLLGLREYGSDGIATYGNSGQPAWDQNDPPSPTFDSGALSNVVNDTISAGGVPPSNKAPHEPIYVVVTNSAVRSDVEDARAYHTLFHHGVLTTFQDEPTVWVTVGDTVGLAHKGGGFNVSGQHRYSEAGTPTVTVSVTDALGNTITPMGSVTVTDAALSATGVALTAVQGGLFSGRVATLTDANSLAVPGDFTVNIAWGDGTTSAASLTQTAAGRFTLSGQHSYQTAGSLPVTVTVMDIGGNTTSATTTAFVTQSQSTSAFRRAFAIGGSGYDESNNVATDPQGDAYVVGDFQGTVNFNPNGSPVNLTAAAPTTAGPLSRDGYLAKYSPTGLLLWVQQFATDATDLVQAVGLSVDGAGNVLVAGWLTGPTRFGGTTLPGTGCGSSGNSIAAFAAKVDSAGNILWADQLGTAALSTYAYFWNVATDAAGDAYAAGGFSGAQTIGGTTLTSVGTWDGLLAKLSPTGTLLWVKNVADGPGFVQALGVGVDQSGNVYTSGAFEGTAHFGGISLTSAGDYDLFALKLNASGQVLWGRAVGGAANDWGGNLTVDHAGNLYISGSTNGDPTVSFSGGQAFVAKLNTSGTVLWTRAYGTGSVNFAESVSLDSAVSLYVGGTFQGSIAFDAVDLTGSGDNSFIAKLNSAGSVQWAHGLAGDQVLGTVLAVEPPSTSMLLAPSTRPSTSTPIRRAPTT